MVCSSGYFSSLEAGVLMCIYVVSILTKLGMSLEIKPQFSMSEKDTTKELLCLLFSVKTACASCIWASEVWLVKAAHGSLASVQTNEQSTSSNRILCTIDYFACLWEYTQWKPFIIAVFSSQSEQELRITQSEFDRQAEITRLLLEGISSTHVSYRSWQ